MTSPNRKLSLEEVLDEFFFSAEAPSSAMVARACNTYPEYREDIMEFAALWSLYEASPEPTAEALGEVDQKSVDRLQSYVLNLLHKQTLGSDPDVDIEVARASIEDLAGGRLRNAAQAASLGECTLLLQKVLTKRIKNTPQVVTHRLAQYLNITRNALENLLGPRIAGPMRYRSSDKPNISTIESWEEAVRSLPVDEVEKKRLLALQEEDPT
jgi:hypothetical protein